MIRARKFVIPLMTLMITSALFTKTSRGEEPTAAQLMVIKPEIYAAPTEKAAPIDKVLLIKSDENGRWWFVCKSGNGVRVGIADKSGSVVMLPEPPSMDEGVGLAFDMARHRVVLAGKGCLAAFDVASYAWSPVDYPFSKGGAIRDICWTPDGLLVATHAGVQRLLGNELATIVQCDPAPNAFAPTPDGAVLVLTHDEGLIKLSGEAWEPVVSGAQKDIFKHALAIVMDERNLPHILTSSGFYAVQDRELRPAPLTAHHSRRTVAVTSGGQIWFAEADKGLQRIDDKGQNLTLPASELLPPSLTITAVEADDDGFFLLVGTNQGLVLIQTEAAVDVVTTETVTTSSYKVLRGAGSNVVATRITLPRGYKTELRYAYLQVQLTQPEGTFIEPVLETDSYGNSVAMLPGDYPWVSWRSVAWERYDKTGALPLDVRKALPVQQNPAETLVYTNLLPGLPPPDRITNYAVSAIKEASRGDALKMCRDILYSPLFTETTSQFDTINMRNSRFRVLMSVALLRSIGLPARLVSLDLERAWGEIWLYDAGWVAYDVGASPVEFWKRYRVQLPVGLDKDHAGVQRIAPQDEIPGVSVITPQQMPPSLQKLADDEFESLDAIESTHLLFVLPASSLEVPERAQFQVSQTAKGFVHLKSGQRAVAIYTTNNVKALDIPLSYYFRAQMLGVPSVFYWEFISADMANWLTLKFRHWQVLDRSGAAPGIQAPAGAAETDK